MKIDQAVMEDNFDPKRISWSRDDTLYDLARRAFWPGVRALLPTATETQMNFVLGDFSVMRVLLYEKAPIDIVRTLLWRCHSFKVTPIDVETALQRRQATNSGDDEDDMDKVVALLFQTGSVNANSVLNTNNGETIMHFFCDQTSPLPMLRLLLRYGKGDPNYKKTTALSPFHLAAQNTSTTSAEMLLLLQYHGDPNMPCTNEGNTALHYAIVDGGDNRLSKVKTLLEHNADPNLKNYSGISPFHLGIIDNVEPSLIALFFHHGANANDPIGSVGPSPLELARNSRCSAEMSWMLGSHGARWRSSSSSLVHGVAKPTSLWPPASMIMSCRHCYAVGTPEKPLLKCKGVCGGAARYCNKNCAASDWKRHKMICAGMPPVPPPNPIIHGKDEN